MTPHKTRPFAEVRFNVQSFVIVLHEEWVLLCGGGERKRERDRERAIMMAPTRVLSWVSLAVAGLVLLQLGSAVEAGDDSLAFVKQVVAEHKLVIFSKSYCPYCRRAKSVFEAMKETPYVIELDERDDGGDIQLALGKFIGRRTVPQVFINGEHIGGSDDTVAAEQSGKLKKLLKGSSARIEQSVESEL